VKARGPFPRWESALPKQDWRSRRSLEIAVGSARRSTKIRVFIDEIGTRDWPAACNRRESWTHSDRRLSQVREREGRGLLKDECWSFPPASEREARMDDPTPRSKKGRETECVFRGLLFPSKGPHLFLFLFWAHTDPDCSSQMYSPRTSKSAIPFPLAPCAATRESPLA
jgi:hypothetical protein